MKTTKRSIANVCKLLIAIILSLAFPGVAVASPYASATGGVAPCGYPAYNSPGTSSTTNAVSDSYVGTWGSFSVSAGGGTFSGGLYPFVILDTYIYQPVWSYGGSSWAAAQGETVSSFYVGPKPGFTSNLSTGDPIPIDFDWGNVSNVTKGTTPYAWGGSNYNGVRYAYNGYNIWWKPLNSSGTEHNLAGYGQWQEVLVSADAFARTQDNIGAWTHTTANAWIRAYVDPDWNNAHSDGYQIYYNAEKADPWPVPEPTTLLLIGPGLIGLLGLRKKFRK